MDYIILDKTSKIPYYIQISDSIKHHINMGTLKHGEQLPTESSLCAIYEVSVIVVKKAYDDLVQKGLIKRIRGKGTFVHTLTPHVIDLSNGIISINQYLTNSKRTVISFDKVKNHTFATTLLDLAEDDYVYTIKTVTNYNDTPMMFQTIYLPEKFFPNLKKEFIKHKTMFELVINMYDLEPQNLHQAYRPVNLQPDIAMILDVPKHTPAFFIRSELTDINKRKLAYFAVHCPAEHLEFEVII